jgi:hypothetical protein
MSERWQRIKALFAEACERPPEAWSSFLNAACAGDASLHAEVESLLEAHLRPSPIDALSEDLHLLLSGVRQAAPAPTGSRIGPYDVIAEIGHGGMGRGTGGEAAAASLATARPGQIRRCQRAAGRRPSAGDKPAGAR